MQSYVMHKPANDPIFTFIEKKRGEGKSGKLAMVAGLNKFLRSDTSYPIGQCCVDIVNMDEEVLDEIDRRVEEFIPAAQALLSKKTNSAVAFAQKKLNAVWNIIFTMPVYRDLNMALELSYHLLERLYEQKEKWE